MPKIVDHDKQKQRVAEAAMRVIRQSGLEQATVRTIAREAGLSPGSMRHYFSTQAELFAFCMNIFRERVEHRIAQMPGERPLLEALQQLLLQFLPVDEDRKMELEVWFSFNAKALVYPELKSLSEAMHDDLYKACHYVVRSVTAQLPAGHGLDEELETEKLYALIDGLAIHHMLRPERLPAERMEFIVGQHLRALLSKPAIP